MQAPFFGFGFLHREMALQKHSSQKNYRISDAHGGESMPVAVFLKQGEQERERERDKIKTEIDRNRERGYRQTERDGRETR